MRPVKRRLRLLLLGSAALSLAGVAPAAAADSSSADVATVGELIVTAQKREQNLREVPQSVSVLSGDNLARQHALSLQDFAAQIPGLSFTESTRGEARLVLRGVNAGGVASTVAVYMDETPFGSSSGLANGGVLAGDFDVFDVARLEVLRGPQGTLYGASSLGGVLKYVTQAPELGSFSARAQGGIESVKGGQTGWSANAVTNAPLGDRAALRVGMFYRKEPAFIDSIGTAGSLVRRNIDAASVYGGRASLLVNPNEALSIRLTALAQNADNDSPTQYDADPLTSKPLYGGYTRSIYYPPESNVKYRLYNGTAEWDLGFANLVSATSFGRLHQSKVEDVTPVALAPGFTYGDLITGTFSTPDEPLGLAYPHSVAQRKFSQELRLASRPDAPLEWLVGAYYTRETGKLGQTFKAFRLGSLQDVDGLPLLASVKLHSVYREYAGFGNVTWHATDRLSLTLGGRYSHNRQKADQALDGALVGGPSAYPTARSSEDVFTYSFAPRYEISKSASLYARVAKGYRPGGPNVLPPGAPADTPTTYDSDSLVSYEAGLKADLLDRRVSLDLSAFYLDWKDIQLFASVNGIGLNANGGKARSQGVELTARATPLAGLALFASGAITDAKLTRDTPAVVGGFDGDRLPYAPKWSLTLGGDYDWALSGATTAYVGATLALVGEQGADFDPAYTAAFGRRLMIDSYERVDLRAGLERGPWRIEVYAKNLTNARGATFAGAFGTLPNNAIGVTPLRPRTLGVLLGASF